MSATLVAVAAACMARGLTPEQADSVAVLLALSPMPSPRTVGQAMRDLDAAIGEVLDS